MIFFYITRQNTVKIKNKNLKRSESLLIEIQVLKFIDVLIKLKTFE